MHPSAQWWSEMAKNTSTPAPAADLNADDAALDLNADGLVSGPATAGERLNSGVNEEDHPEPDDKESSDDDEPEYVVLKGNSIRHDGDVYRENSTIPVTGKDAIRLLQSGVIADIRELRKRALAAQPSVTVTTE